MGRDTAHPVTARLPGKQSSDRDLGQVFGLLPRLPLFDGPQQVVGVSPTEALADVEDFNTTRSQQMPVVPGFIVVNTTEALHIVNDHVAETTAGFLRVGHHLLKCLPPERAGATDRIVHVVLVQLQLLLFCVLFHRLALVGDGLLLAISGSAEIADGSAPPRRVCRAVCHCVGLLAPPAQEVPHQACALPAKA